VLIGDHQRLIDQGHLSRQFLIGGTPIAVAATVAASSSSCNACSAAASSIASHRYR
jgi:hypothetical protein